MKGLPLPIKSSQILQTIDVSKKRKTIFVINSLITKSCKDCNKLYITVLYY